MVLPVRSKLAGAEKGVAAWVLPDEKKSMKKKSGRKKRRFVVTTTPFERKKYFE